jgi:hypothetical protein
MFKMGRRALGWYIFAGAGKNILRKWPCVLRKQLYIQKVGYFEEINSFGVLIKFITLILISMKQKNMAGKAGKLKITMITVNNLHNEKLIEIRGGGQSDSCNNETVATRLGGCSNSSGSIRTLGG